jgi:UDP-N-acetylglucosamine/UDP-N-acetylgalactosamine diphosphorylase
MFVFDLIPRADSALFFETDRLEEFAPLKNRTGADSVETCVAGQIEKAARWLGKCGVDVPRGRDDRSLYKLEISPLFALESEDLRERLAGRETKIDKDCVFA